jgi:outer membrane beta-barrel protein
MNLQYAPAPKYLVLADYQYTGFYGKISLSKEFVMNLSLYGLAGIGAFGIGDMVAPSVDLGIGQKLYFSPNFALRADFRLVVYQGPNVLSRDLESATSVQSASSFSTSTLYVSLLSIGMIYLFPGM